MNALARVALLAYPRQFRRQYGHEWTRTINDLRMHHGLSTTRIAATVMAEAATVALRMRWENLMPATRAILTVLTLIVTLAAFVVGSPAIAVMVAALVVLGAVQFAGRDRPIAPADPSATRRWWLWLAGSAAAFLIGVAVVAIDGDDDLATAAWATWLVSWAAAVLLAAVGVGLAATRLAITRR